MLPTFKSKSKSNTSSTLASRFWLRPFTVPPTSNFPEILSNLNVLENESQPFSATFADAVLEILPFGVKIISSLSRYSIDLNCGSNAAKSETFTTLPKSFSGSKVPPLSPSPSIEYVIDSVPPTVLMPVTVKYW